MVNFTEIFIKRPVLSIVLSLLIFFAGVVSFFSLQIREYPYVATTVINVFVSYPGASSEIIESSITTPIENAIGGVDGIDYISSESADGFVNIGIYFKLGYDVNAALADITNAVSSARWKLPKDVQDPIISKQDKFVNPSMNLAFRDLTKSSEELTDYLSRIIQPQLQILNGVGSASIDGGEPYAMRLWFNPYAMAARNVTTQDIYRAIATGQLQAATGAIKNLWQQISINAITGMSTADQFNSLVIRNDNGQLTKLMDVGRAELGARYNDFFISLDNTPGVLINIYPKSDANPLEISRLVKEELQRIQKYFPAGLSSYVLFDSGDYIKASIDEIEKTLVVATIFVMLIVFIFLGSIRILLIPVVMIPLSIVGVFLIMFFCGYSINTLTLLALVLSIGMVVDDAIVVAENVYRHMGLGKSPFEAAIDGAKEIQFAIIAITLTLAAVYAPIVFASGLTKALFKEFAFTLVAAVIISGFAALTLSPMMCSKIMVAEVTSKRFYIFVHNVTALITKFYGELLQKVLNKCGIVIVSLMMILAFCGISYYFLPKDLAPKEDVGWMYTVASAPAAANFEYTKKYANRLNSIYTQISEIAHYGIVVGNNAVNSAKAFITLKPWGQRKRDLDTIIEDLQFRYSQMVGIQTFSFNPHTLPGSSSGIPIAVAVQSTGSFEELNHIMQKLIHAIKQNPNFLNVDTNLKIDQPQLDVIVERNKAGALGISMQDIVDAISFAFSEAKTVQFTMNGRDYDVVPQLDAQYKDRFDAINNLQLRTSSGELVPLSNLVTLKESIRPRTLVHFQQVRYAGLSASLVPGYSVGKALKYIEGEAKKILPGNMKLDYMGQSRQFLEASSSMYITFTIALVFIFLILAAQFESFRDPLIIMFSVPLSIFGALVALLFIRGSLNIYSEIGLITLIGLISKHGVLMVEFANQLRSKGLVIKEAIIEAAKIRFRPILMTTCAIILGALPLAFASGAGAISRHQIGWVIVGGMFIGTLVTLFVVPTMYMLLAADKSKNKLM